MAQATVNMSISLPKELKKLVKERVEKDHFGTPSDYLRSLIREDLRKRDQERLEQALLNGLDSGRGVAYGTKKWSAFKKGIIAKIARKKK